MLRGTVVPQYFIEGKNPGFRPHGTLTVKSKLFDWWKILSLNFYRRRNRFFVCLAPDAKRDYRILLTVQLKEPGKITSPSCASPDVHDFNQINSLPLCSVPSPHFTHSHSITLPIIHSDICSIAPRLYPLPPQPLSLPKAWPKFTIFDPPTLYSEN